MSARQRLSSASERAIASKGVIGLSRLGASVDVPLDGLPEADDDRLRPGLSRLPVPLASGGCSGEESARVTDRAGSLAENCGCSCVAGPRGSQFGPGHPGRRDWASARLLASANRWARQVSSSDSEASAAQEAAPSASELSEGSANEGALELAADCDRRVDRRVEPDRLREEPEEARLKDRQSRSPLGVTDVSGSS